MRMFAKMSFGAPLLATLLMFGCSAPDDIELSSKCGEGEEVSYSGEVYCVYRGPIIETRFQCPQDYGTRHDLGDGQTVVCSKGDDLPGGFEEHLKDGGWQIDDPNNQMNPPNLDPNKVPNNKPSPNNTTPVETPFEFEGFWMFDATMLHARSASYYVIEPSTLIQADSPESFRLLGRSIAREGIPRSCHAGGEWTTSGEATMRVQTNCEGIELEVTFASVEAFDNVYDVSLRAVGLDEDEEDVSAQMSWRAIRCSIESGVPVCAIDLPRDEDAVEPPIIEAPSEPHFPTSGHWDIEAPTGAIRIATYEFTDSESILKGTSMEDFVIGVTLFPPAMATDEPTITCPANGPSETSQNGRVRTITSSCDDGITRQIEVEIIGDFDFTQPDSYYAYTFETRLVNGLPPDYEAREFWGGPLAARPCTLEEGPRQCFNFQEQPGNLFFYGSFCEYDEGTCERVRHCESVRDANDDFVSCQTIECAAVTNAQTCFELPHCQGVFTGDGGQEEAFDSCQETRSCELEDATRDTNVCVDSGGVWVREVGNDPGSCDCGNDPELRRLYGRTSYSRGFGCQYAMEYCGLLGGTWTLPQYTNETIRTDIAQADCVSDPATPTIELVWNDTTLVCHRFDFDDTNSYCLLDGVKEYDPRSIHEAMFGPGWPSYCPAP